MNAPLWAWLSLGVVVLLLIAVIWSIRVHRDPILRIYSASAVDQLIPTLAGLTLSTPLAGNSVEVLENGAYFDVLLERIRGAERSVHFETFLWKEGVLGRPLADALVRAGSRGQASARAAGRQRLAQREPGHAVNSCARGDASSCFSTTARFATLGCSLTETTASSSLSTASRPLSAAIASWTRGRAMRKTINTIADVSVWLHGPIVHSVQAAFSENWAGETGELFGGDDVFPAWNRRATCWSTRPT